MCESQVTMDSAANTIILSGVPLLGNTYKLRANKASAEDRVGEVTIPTERLVEWLLAKGCDFCAHQVKLGRAVRCDHVEISEVELAGFGL